MIYVILYLVAILSANIDIVLVQQWLGATDNVRLAITTINAFVFIAFDLTARDGLHDAWHQRRLVPKMIALIASGSFLSWFLNRQAGRIALASFTAFACAGVVDAIIYHVLLRCGKAKFTRINGSNLASAGVDSFLFPTLAFGGLVWLNVFSLFLAKVVGGFLWACMLSSGEKTDA